jgi:hypothetical protein
MNYEDEITRFETVCTPNRNTPVAHESRVRSHFGNQLVRYVPTET